MKQLPQRVSAVCAAMLGVSTAFAADWLVIDLPTDRSAARWNVRDSAAGPDVAKESCRTSELWLRLLPGTDGTYAAAFETTQEQYRRVTGESPSRHVGPTRPVECVSWKDARKKFLSVLSAKTGLSCELPSESVWIKACMAGVAGCGFYNGAPVRSHEEHAIDDICRYGNNRHDGRGGFEQHTVVGSYKPNAWGLYDMHGNLSEMCLEHLGGKFPRTKYMKLKGGNWYPCMETSTAWSCTAGSGCGEYYYADEDYRSDIVGFRTFATRKNGGAK